MEVVPLYASFLQEQPLGPSANRCIKARAFCPLVRAGSLVWGCTVPPGPSFQVSAYLSRKCCWEGLHAYSNKLRTLSW